LVNAGWATIVSARGAIEARVLVTDRMTPLTVRGRRMHQVGMPYHFGPNGLATGDAVNTLTSASLDPNAHIQEVKALAVDVVPGRRPRGPALLDLISSYQQRAGVTVSTGTEV
jgi:formate dehydrogenase major subunit